MSENKFFDFVHQNLDLLGSSEVSVLRNISGLSSGRVHKSCHMQAVAVAQESQVLNITLLVAIDSGHSSNLVVLDWALQQSQDLLELLWRNLEVIVAIMILEEALGIESLPDHELSKVLTQLIDQTLILIGGIDLSVV